MNKKANLENFFNPRSVAIVGASEAEGKVGWAVTRNILKLGYAGQVFLVNPSHEQIFGQKCYSSLEAIEKPVDLAIIAIPAKFVLETIEKSAQKIKNFVVISAGFSETGEEGKDREAELQKLAEENKLNILGPNCLGFIIPEIKLNASFAGGMPEAGRVALVSQSGALATAMLDMVAKKNIKFSAVVSVGNKMQLDETKLMEYFEKDENTKVIGMYLEGIKDGNKFIETAQRVARTKPIVILKAGKTERTQRAISSHTGALAGSDAIMNAAFRKAGIIRAHTVDEFLSFLKVASVAPVPQNKEVAVLTNAGGLGVLATDAFQGKTIALAEIKAETKEKLKAFLPGESSLENPIDLLGDAREDRYAQALEILASESVGSIVCLLTPQEQTPVEKIAEAIIAFKNKTEKLVATVFMGGTKVEAAVAQLKMNDIPNFSVPELAIGALENYYQWNLQKDNLASVSGVVIDKERAESVKKIVAEAQGEGRKALFYGEAQAVMQKYGLETAETYALGEAGIKFPVVVKVDSDKVLHKSDQQGLILGVQDKDDLFSAVEKMKASFPGEKVIIQPMLDKKMELIVGLKRDAIFGSVVVVGLGGIYTEIFKLAEFVVGSETEEKLVEFLEQGALNFLFQGARGQRAYDTKELARILMGVKTLAEEVPEISALDINPLLVYNDGRSAVAVDVKIIL